MNNTRQLAHRKNREFSVPKDPLIPGLSRLLNWNSFKHLLNNRLGGALGPIAAGDIVYVRYKPGTNCIIAYSLECARENLWRSSRFLVYAKVFTEDDYPTALEKSRQRRWIRVSGLEPFIPLTAEKSILYVFPNDPVIEGLRLLSDSKKLQRILYENLERYPETRWRISDKRTRLTPVRYKPERRMVVRCDTWAAHRESTERSRLKLYLRFYADDTGKDVYGLQKALHESSREPGYFLVSRPLAYIDDRRLLMLEKLPGQPLYEKILGGQAEKAVLKTAIALAKLHERSATGLQKRDIESYLDDARATCSMLKALLPENRDLTSMVMDRLENHNQEDEPSAIGFVHGDFYYGQVLTHQKEIGILDFDRSHSGHSISDIGNFCAHLRLLRLGGQLDDDSTLGDGFISTYEQASGRKIDRREIAFWTAYGLFQLAVGPFRRLEPDWRRRTGEILEECHRILS